MTRRMRRMLPAFEALNGDQRRRSHGPGNLAAGPRCLVPMPPVSAGDMAANRVVEGRYQMNHDFCRSKSSMASLVPDTRAMLSLSKICEQGRTAG